MKTEVLSLICLFLTILISGQTKHKFKTRTLTGYEYNYFKSPEEILRGGKLFTKDKLIKSSAYQDIKVNYSYKYKYNLHKINFSTTPKTRLFYNNSNDSYWSLHTNLKYTYNLIKRTKLFLNTSFLRMARKGLDGDQDVLVNPLGYSNYGLNVGVFFKPINKNSTTIETFFKFRDYDKFGTRDLEYKEFGVQLNTVQSFKPNKLIHKYGITSSFRKRDYKVFNAASTKPNKERNWNLIYAMAFYQYPISKKLKVKSGYYYLTRIDKLNNKSGYKQHGPSLQIKFRSKKTILSTSFKYLSRNYANLKSKNNDGFIGEKIKYKYFEFSANMSHKLGKNGFYLTANAYSMLRSTNFTNIRARSFRGYRNQYAGVGVKWELK
ncbi:hypothetical protein [Polaribacter cellanae]|uniref:Uncharacterized protein n=1 Tax=Polaribacter cellanae TaxID=2818493 RepID=A0A975H9S3_9FLAO|nr:hypothetical protein [Polaribacter cellanae]QTE23265.1 hypothetical protein J3359_03035 [Polaribacter cellanae]